MDINQEIQNIENEISDTCNKVVKLNEKKRELQRQAVYCPDCRKYFPKEGIKIDKKIKTFVETVYNDCGYGDDDELGEVVYEVTYAFCPTCEKAISIGEKYLYTNKDIWRRGNHQ